jgi:hypothetical protein
MGKKKPPAFASGWSHPLVGQSCFSAGLEERQNRANPPVDVMVSIENRRCV